MDHRIFTALGPGNVRKDTVVRLQLTMPIIECWTQIAFKWGGGGAWHYPCGQFLLVNDTSLSKQAVLSPLITHHHEVNARIISRALLTTLVVVGGYSIALPCWQVYLR